MLASGGACRRLDERGKNEIDILIFSSSITSNMLVVSSTLKDKVFIKCIFFIIVLGLIVSIPNLCHLELGSL